QGKIAQLEILDPELGRELVGARLEQWRGRRVSGDSAVRAEGQRHERVPEEQASNLRERQYRDDVAAALRVEVPRAVTELLLEELRPRGKMEERRVGADAHERVPTLPIAGRQQSDDEITRAHRASSASDT